MREQLTRSDQRDSELEALKVRLSRLSAAGLRINESPDSARYGVMTLLGNRGMVEGFLASGLSGEDRTDTAVHAARAAATIARSRASSRATHHAPDTAAETGAPTASPPATSSASRTPDTEHSPDTAHS